MLVLLWKVEEDCGMLVLDIPLYYTRDVNFLR